MSDIPNFIRDDTPVEISCRCCGKRFTKRADEGASMCYECYEKDPVSTLIADLKTRYGYFEFADHISKPKMDAFVEWFKDAANKIHAIGYKHGMEDKIKETTK
jgi:hypothetical protein